MRELTFNELESVSGGAWWDYITQTATAIGKAAVAVGNLLCGLANANLIPDQWTIPNVIEDYFDAFCNWVAQAFIAFGSGC